MTSPEVITNLICDNSGTITLLSTSNILNPPESSKSELGIIYESNSINSSLESIKSGYW